MGCISWEEIEVIFRNFNRANWPFTTVSFTQSELSACGYRRSLVEEALDIGNAAVKRPKIGDVIEIDTVQGLAYAHYSHRNKEWGALLRVFNGRYLERPADFVSAMSGDPSFLVFFPLGGIFNRGIVSIAGHVPLTAEAQVFPRFRSGVPSAETGRVATWWIWDGEQSHRVGNLTDEIRSLSTLGVCNDTYLIAKILKNYTPETDTELDGWAKP